MARGLVIKNGRVENIVIVDPNDIPKHLESVVIIPPDMRASVGWTWDGTKAIEPAAKPVDPSSIEERIKALEAKP